jgi:hypothetical protein
MVYRKVLLNGGGGRVEKFSVLLEREELSWHKIGFANKQSQAGRDSSGKLISVNLARVKIDEVCFLVLFTTSRVEKKLKRHSPSRKSQSRNRERNEIKEINDIGNDIRTQQSFLLTSKVYVMSKIERGEEKIRKA